MTKDEMKNQFLSSTLMYDAQLKPKEAVQAESVVLLEEDRNPFKLTRNPSQSSRKASMKSSLLRSASEFGDTQNMAQQIFGDTSKVHLLSG